MKKEVILERLTQDSVNIVIITFEATEAELPKWDGMLSEDIELPKPGETQIELQETSRWRTALQNTTVGRKQLQNVLGDFSDELTEVMTAWGNTPTLEMPAPPPVDTDILRMIKLTEVGNAATAAIHAGIEVNGKRYSLTEHDQIDLMAQMSAIQAGAPAVPYHADGELCRMFTAEEFMLIADAAMAHIFFHRTYCNHLNAWIRRAETADDIQAIFYTGDVCSLPDDLAKSITDILKAVQ